jgi:hypothetical protein
MHQNQQFLTYSRLSVVLVVAWMEISYLNILELFNI